MRLTIVILFFSGALATAYAACTLSKSVVENEERIFAIGSPNQFTLLLNETVADGATLYLLCPNSTHSVVSSRCKNGTFSHPLPVGNCAGYSAHAISITDSSCPVQSYAVGYTVNGQFLEVYRTCYDQQGVRALRTTHTAVAYKLKTKRPEVKFDIDGIITPAAAATFSRQNVYAVFVRLFGANQKYIPPGNITFIARGHLTPSADYLFFDNMRSTFKFINVVPQFQSINTGNWKTIENYVREYVKTVPSATVTTGAHDVLQLPDANNNLVPIYLAANNQNPIPKWMYKIVTSAQGSHVFLTYNNVYYSTPEVFRGICNQVPCPIDFSRSKPRSGFTVCCNPATFQV